MCPIFTTRINLHEVKDGFNQKLRKLAESPTVSSLTISGYIYKLLKVWDLFEDDVFFLSSDLAERSSNTSTPGMELAGSHLTKSILHHDNLRDSIHEDFQDGVYEDLDAPRFRK